MSSELICAGRSLVGHIRLHVALVDDSGHGRTIQGYAWQASKPACIPAQPLDEMVERFRHLLNPTRQSPVPVGPDHPPLPAGPGRLEQLTLELESLMRGSRRESDDVTVGPRYCSLRITKRWADGFEAELANREAAMKPIVVRTARSRKATRSDPEQKNKGSRTIRKVPRGRLDEQAAIEQKKNPSLTINQLSAILECNASTLRDPKRYPLLAAVKAEIREQREEFRNGSTWRSRDLYEDGD